MSKIDVYLYATRGQGGYKNIKENIIKIFPWKKKNRKFVNMVNVQAQRLGWSHLFLKMLPPPHSQQT